MQLLAHRSRHSHIPDGEPSSSICRKGSKTYQKPIPVAISLMCMASLQSMPYFRSLRHSTQDSSYRPHPPQCSVNPVHRDDRHLHLIDCQYRHLDCDGIIQRPFNRAHKHPTHVSEYPCLPLPYSPRSR